MIQHFCCIYCLIDNPWFQGIIGGFFAGIITATVIWFIRKLNKEYHYAKYYSRFVGNYKQYQKRDKTKKEKGRITLTRTGNQFNVAIIINDSPVNGVITMDDRMPLYGRGYYKHESGQAWGFYEITLNVYKEEIYVHRDYYHPTGENKQAFIWEKIKE